MHTLLNRVFRCLLLRLDERKKERKKELMKKGKKERKNERKKERKNERNKTALKWHRSSEDSQEGHSTPVRVSRHAGRPLMRKGIHSAMRDLDVDKLERKEINSCVK